MVASTEKNKALTSTQEGIIAGLVFIVFGLLYWYLNPWNSEEKPSQRLTGQASATDTLTNTVKHTAHTTTPTTTDTQTDLAAANTTAPAATATPPTHVAITGAAKPVLNTPTTTAAPTITTEPTTAAAATPPSVPTAPTVPTETITATSATAANLLPPPGPVEAVKTEQTSTDSAMPNKLELAPGSPEAKLQTYLNDGRLETPVVMDNINFEPKTTQITKESEANVLLLAALLAQYPQANFLIASYTDETNPDNKNSSELSLMRANALGVQLVKAGVDGKRITIMGMNSQTSPDQTSATSKKSQRIEISVIK